MMKYYTLSPVRNKLNKAVGLLRGKFSTILERKRQTGMNISNGVKTIGLVWVMAVGSVLFYPNFTSARVHLVNGFGIVRGISDIRLSQVINEEKIEILMNKLIGENKMRDLKCEILGIFQEENLNSILERSIDY